MQYPESYASSPLIQIVDKDYVAGYVTAGGQSQYGMGPVPLQVCTGHGKTDPGMARFVPE